MKLFIRAHDLGVRGEDAVIERLNELGLDGIQLVAYKVLPDVPYMPGAMTERRAKQINAKLKAQSKSIPLIGAYFNPVHSDACKVANSVAVFENYLAQAPNLGSSVVGSETGSYNDDKWTYHPSNRTDAALNRVVETFSHLADVAEQYGVNIGMEGAYGHVCYSVDRLAEAVARIGKSNIKIIFDLYNYLSCDNVNDRYAILEHGLETFKDKICVFHIKDCTIENGRLKQCGVGKGIFDYRLILSMIAKYLPDANLVFEGTVGEDIPFAVQYIRSILGENNEV